MRGDIISGLGAYKRAVTDYQSAMKLGAEVKEKATRPPATGRETNREKSDRPWRWFLLEGGRLLQNQTLLFLSLLLLLLLLLVVVVVVVVVVFLTYFFERG